MAIPRAREEAPPPLPPPRHIDLSGRDPGWQWGNTNSPRDTGFGGNRLATVRPGSSLYGGATGSYPREPSVDMFSPAREPSVSRSVDGMSEHSNTSEDDRSNKARPSLKNHRLTSERQLGHKAVQNSSHAYDKQLLSKIGGPNTPTRTTASSISSASTHDPAASDTHVPSHKLSGQLKPLTVPTISPSYNGWRSPGFDSAESQRARYGSISTPGPLDETSSQHRGSYDHSIFSDPEFGGMEENGMRDLNINERSPAESEDYQLGPKGGLKRRASSPPSEAARDDRPIPSGHNDLYHRRSQQMLVNRNCAASRFQSNSNSLSSTGSKPKEFDSEDELRAHELEKQYICQYCPNRFKNKNEAERHQNSLHLRRHSWSCATLAGVHAAFHPSPTRPNVADVCGYCGEEFSNPADWEARSEHLNHVHKFGECNQAKKFFRADHFRQHLKHSHAGTSGKWTNMLENACMRDEPPPQERVGSMGSISGPSSLAPKPGVINEAHDEA
ncbi:unnamed protein product [Alternaria alternata]